MRRIIIIEEEEAPEQRPYGPKDNDPCASCPNKGKGACVCSLPKGFTC